MTGWIVGYIVMIFAMQFVLLLATSGRPDRSEIPQNECIAIVLLSFIWPLTLVILFFMYVFNISHKLAKLIIQHVKEKEDAE